MGLCRELPSLRFLSFPLFLLFLLPFEDLALVLVNWKLIRVLMLPFPHPVYSLGAILFWPVAAHAGKSPDKAIFAGFVVCTGGGCLLPPFSPSSKMWIERLALLKRLTS
jgi:hypothetical protein